MLNNIINSNISHNYNEINKLIFLKRQREKKIKETYNNIYISKENYFKIPKSIKLNHNLDNLENNDSNINIHKNIKKINNVLKINFKNAPSTGFGDFIRGCYFLLELCESNNIDVDFHIYDSNIKYYLKYFYLKPIVNEQIANNIYKFLKNNATFTNNKGIIGYDIDNNIDNNINDFINYLNVQRVYSNNIFINTVNFPSHYISQSHITRMKTILEPTDFFKTEIDNLINKLGLIKNNFITYHIRLGDVFLENQFELIQNNKLYQIIEKLNIDSNNNYLLVSDSMLVKNVLTKKYPKLKTIENEIVHTSQNNNNDKIKNTLLDFYLMSYSIEIVSFSVYPHGSGFSKWCATTYEIPYICYALL
jgi:hypothetical protein